MKTKFEQILSNEVQGFNTRLKKIQDSVLPKYSFVTGFDNSINYQNTSTQNYSRETKSGIKLEKFFLFCLAE